MQVKEKKYTDFDEAMTVHKMLKYNSKETLS